jgi:uncharacterized protein YggE
MIRRPSLLVSLILCAAPVARGEPAGGFLLAPAQRTITVSAGAEVRVVPDEIVLQFSVEERNRVLDEAVKACDTRTKAVLKFLGDAGIGGKDVHSQFISIEPHHRNHQGVEVLVPEHFSAHRGFIVRLREVGKFDELLAGILRNGAQRVQDVSFRNTELRKHRDIARQKAIRAAREKAVALAGELDATVGKPQSITEVSGGGDGGRSRSDQPMTQNVYRTEGVGADPEDQMVALGTISVTSKVTVVFQLE